MTILILIAGGVALAWLSWISLQSLLQARLLRETHKLAGVMLEPDVRAAIHGTVRVTRSIDSAGLRNVLWYKRTQQEKRGFGKNSQWATVDEEEETAEFCVETADRAVWVADQPSEVQSMSSETHYSEGWSERIITKWLPFSPTITAVGRIQRRGETWALVRDGKAGLLLSPHEPGRAAFTEAAKGVIGLLAVTAGIIIGIKMYYQNR